MSGGIRCAWRTWCTTWRPTDWGADPDPQWVWASTSADTLPPIRTKIVATVGPASREPAVLRKLIDAGVNVFRLNFSHGSHEEHSVLLANIRRIGREADRQIAVLQDLSGPKMRLGPIPGDLVE